MYTSSYDPKNQPLFHFKGYPVRLAMLLVVIHVTAFVVTSFAGPFAGHWLELTISRSYVDGSIEWPSWWRWGTYILDHSGQSVFFILDMFFLWVFGSQLELVLGRKFLIRLYLVLIAFPALLALAAVLLKYDNATLSGASHAHFSLFLAFAFLEPNAPTFFGIKIKYLAGALFAVYMLQHIQFRDGLAIATQLSCALLTYFIMRRHGLAPRFERVSEAFSTALPRPGRRKKVPRALPYEPKMQPRLEVREDRRAVEKIDAILEKISRTGVESLDEWERRELERASKELKRQDS
jgi:membrane associated rhomboid family serine protease